MKMTIVTDSKGKLIASAFEDPAKEEAVDGPSASLRPGPGQAFEEIDVPDDYARLTPEELHRELRQKYLSRKSR